MRDAVTPIECEQCGLLLSNYALQYIWWSIYFNLSHLVSSLYCMHGYQDLFICKIKSDINGVGVSVLTLVYDFWLFTRLCLKKKKKES